MSEREDENNLSICLMETFYCSLPMSPVNSVMSHWSKTKQTLRKMYNTNLKIPASSMWGPFGTEVKDLM